MLIKTRMQRSPGRSERVSKPTLAHFTESSMAAPMFTSLPVATSSWCRMTASQLQQAEGCAMTGDGVAHETACSEIMQFTMECRWLVPFSANSRSEPSAQLTVAAQGDRKLRSRVQFASVRVHVAQGVTFCKCGSTRPPGVHAARATGLPVPLSNQTDRAWTDARQSLSLSLLSRDRSLANFWPVR